MPGGLRHRVGELDHLASIARLQEMLGAKVRVTEMDAELDIRRNGLADPLQAAEDVLVRGANLGKHVERLSVPDQHLMADIPLDAEVMMWNSRAHRLDLPDHVPLIG